MAKKELLFDIDSFNSPKVLEGTKADAQLIYYGLMGRDSSRVTEGVVYAIRRYRFDELRSAKSQIEATLRDYCTKHIPGIFIDELTIQPRTDTSLLLVISVAEDYTSPTYNIVFNVQDKQTKLLVDIL